MINGSEWKCHRNAIDILVVHHDQVSLLFERSSCFRGFIYRTPGFSTSVSGALRSSVEMKPTRSQTVMQCV
jgi:hypothetical protein